ncbi:MAG: hypothetical protein VB035_06185 [Candidatus Fimivivens sp.]|nr:hypothetical protein [Candidatus Fimivivens sp.]
MIVKATVSAVEGKKYRVLVNGRVSAALPHLTVVKNSADEEPIVIGDTVVAVFYSDTMADGAVLGKVDEV